MTALERKKIALARQSKSIEDNKVVVDDKTTDEEILTLYHIAEIMEFYDYNYNSVYVKAGEFYVTFNTKRKTLLTLTNEYYILYRNTILALEDNGYKVRILVSDEEREVEFTHQELEALIWQNNH